MTPPGSAGLSVPRSQIKKSGGNGDWPGYIDRDGPGGNGLSTATPWDQSERVSGGIIDRGGAAQMAGKKSGGLR